MVMQKDSTTGRVTIIELRGKTKPQALLGVAQSK